jgi:hypothetical protein
MYKSDIIDGLFLINLRILSVGRVGSRQNRMKKGDKLVELWMDEFV